MGYVAILEGFMVVIGTGILSKGVMTTTLDKSAKRRKANDYELHTNLSGIGGTTFVVGASERVTTQLLSIKNT